LSDKHLNPNRGWTLIRDGGHFTPAEIEHLKHCEQCSEWLSLFADLARSAGFKPDLDEAFFFIAEDRHLTAGRAWSLIRDRGQLTLPETGHLYYCSVCNDWLSRFAATARRAGFFITFEIPPCDSQRNEKIG
jgi:predicted anti-sigma-YlaC factor YlaD